MGSQEALILIDTNIFVIDLRYKRDVNYNSNLSFLEAVRQRGTGFTMKNSYFISGGIFKIATR
ncbi:MAG: hypothetical protein JRF52_13405 [Deltaproteobacteria bacterium]|nr:hypothetical protein [Deltaproteobacteria bacterium]